MTDHTSRTYQKPAGDYARVIQVIETTLLIRGNGADEPYRSVRQYWSFDGKLLAEVDRWQGNRTQDE